MENKKITNLILINEKYVDYSNNLLTKLIVSNCSNILLKKLKMKLKLE